MGDVTQGVLLGASINLVFLGVISAGGSQPADPSLAGWLGTALAMSAGLGQQEAIAIAAPLGIIGLLGFFSRMNVDVAFVHWADERAEKGDIDGVARMNWVPGQLYVFVTTFIPVVFLALAGSAALDSLFNAIDPFRGGSADWRWVRDWFIVGGSVLTAVGIGINLNLILRGSTIPYFLIGFTISALTGVNLIAMGVLAGSLAVLHVMFTRRQNVSAGA
jgi:PTS system mannose-specific IIC component